MDLVKAALQLVLAVHANEAITAARQAMHVADSAVHKAGVSAPHSIVTLAAEAVSAPTKDQILRLHIAHGGTGYVASDSARAAGKGSPTVAVIGAMTLAVTGATGRLGGRVARRLAAVGRTSGCWCATWTARRSCPVLK